MKLTHGIVACLLCLAFSGILGIQAARADNWIAPESRLNPGSVVVPSMQWLLDGPQAYYRVYGKWPETWQAVVSAGFVTAPLNDGFGHVIDPDDHSWDFDGDCQYFLEDGKPQIACWNSSNNSLSRMPVTQSFKTWDDKFAAQSEEIMASNPGLIGNKARQQQLALAWLLIQGSNFFVEVYGRAPESLQELAESKLGPLRAGTLNPLTGQPYAGDGSANDFHFSVQVEDNNVSAFDIYPVDEKGERFWKGSL